MSKINKKNDYNKKSILKNTLKNKKKLTQFGGTNDSIYVLSWNICWQTMTGITNTEASAKLVDLVKRCNSEKDEYDFNKCVANVITTIDSISIESNNYDFVALQEASNWRRIRAKSEKLNTMGYVHHRVGSTKEVDLVTFYDNTKYELTFIKVGQISKGRPYHILILRNRKTGSSYIFINLHNSHSYTKEPLEHLLSKDLNKFKRVYNSGTKISNAQLLNDEFPKIIESMAKDTKPINLIVAGDFNDDDIEHKNFWTGLKPFIESEIPNIEKIKNLEERHE